MKTRPPESSVSESKPWHHSLKNQLTVIFIGLVFLSILTITFINSVFLERYYISRKTDILVETMELLWDREIMTMAGESVLRLAAMEKQRGQLARADRLYREFLTNYRRHVSAASTASSMLGEAMRGERWADAIGLCRLVQKYYTNSIYYAASYSQESYCHSKLDERAEAIAAMKKYVEVEFWRASPM